MQIYFSLLIYIYFILLLLSIEITFLFSSHQNIVIHVNTLKQLGHKTKLRALG